MAWSWSHTDEAYSNARENLGALPLETLQVIRAEWDARYVNAEPWEESFSEAKYRRALARVKREDMPADFLADEIWDRASEQATCDNGGFNAWTCPYGCGPHTVSFDREEVTV